MRSLRTKIALGYLAIILVNVLMVIFVIYHVKQLSQPINQILGEKYHNVNAAENMKQALAQQEAAQFAMIEEGFDSTFYYGFITYRNEFLNAHQRAIEGVALSQEPEILDSLMLIFKTYLQHSDSLQAMIQNNSSYRLIKIYHYQTILPLVMKIDSLCTLLKDVNLEAIDQANLSAQKIAARTTKVIIIFSLFLISLSVMASFYFTKRIFKPIQQTTETVKKIGEGNWDQKLQLIAEDEIGQLAREFNRMTARLAAYEKMNIEKIIIEKKKSEAIINNIPSAIIVTDANGRINLMNQLALEIFNITDDSYLNQNISNYIDTDFLSTFVNIENGNKEEAPPPPKLIAFRNQDNDEEVYYQLHPLIIYNDQHQRQSMIFLLQDVTSFKKLDQLKSDLMATISHELKTPLTSLNMGVDILLREVKGKLNKEQKALLRDAKSDIRRLKDFVAELLEFSRLESGHYQMKWQTIDVRQLIDYSCQTFQKAIDQKEINFQIDIADEITSFTGDFQNMSRVLSNILQNAIEHVPQKGQILLKVNQEKERILFTIQDNGPGIPLEAQPFIFEKFSRVAKFENSKSGNVGLGLAIAREIIQKHKGKLWLKSMPGKGSTFYIEIPLNQTQEKPNDI